MMLPPPLTSLSPLSPILILSLTRLIRPLTSRVHSVIGALCKPILPLSIMRDNSTVDGARVIIGNTSDDDAVGTRALTVVCAAGARDGKFEVGGLCVLEGEVFVVVVGVGVLVAA